MLSFSLIQFHIYNLKLKYFLKDIVKIYCIFEYAVTIRVGSYTREY